jgi:hypothetical protein
MGLALNYVSPSYLSPYINRQSWKQGDKKKGSVYVHFIRFAWEERLPFSNKLFDYKDKVILI